LIRVQNRRASFAVRRQVVSAVYTEVGHTRLRPDPESARKKGIAVDGVLDRSNPMIRTEKEELVPVFRPDRKSPAAIRDLPSAAGAWIRLDEHVRTAEFGRYVGDPSAVRRELRLRNRRRRVEELRRCAEARMLGIALDRRDPDLALGVEG